MERLNTFGIIKDGKLEISNRHIIDGWISQCNEGDNIVVKFVNSKDYHSLRQLKLIYHCFREISKITGYSVSDVKTLMKMEQGFCQTHEIGGKEITDCKSLSEFSKKELSEFIMNVDLWSTKTLSSPLLNNDDIKFLKI